MNLNINDILASLTKPPSPSTSASTASFSAYDGATATTDHIQLTRAWQSERSTSHLLPYPTALITCILTRLRHQIARIEDLTAGVDSTPNTGNASDSGFNGHNNRNRSNGDNGIWNGTGGNANANVNLVLSILQTDLGRTQFLLRSYLRQRLAKITRHGIYYLKHHTDTPQNQDQTRDDTGSRKNTTHRVLSDPELSFLRHQQYLLNQLYSAAFLDSLPVSLRKLDERTGGTRMDDSPDHEEGVIIRCLAREWESRDIDTAGAEAGQDDEDRDGDERGIEKVKIGFKRGDIGIVRWRDVKAGVLGGDLELL